MGFIKDGLSIDETKVSVLLILLIGVVAFVVVMYAKTQIIGDNLTTICTALIYSVAGVNIATQVGNAFNTSSTDDYSSVG